ncbi:2,3-diaminopropionate biosynthesis protein SbnB [Nonomuraea sp. NPDC049709]|uniref:2,3-diaminopropionate biosynthesis protein SbnB n=1 Tax=Nonomuraea sp. NPDC049709 TaxID=3154736 RepID=UPI003431488F
MRLTVISAAEIAQQVEGNRHICLDLVRRAYLAYAEGHSALPFSSFLRFPGRPRDRIIALPAYLGGEFDVSGLKWIASYPGNVEQGLPRASGLLVLNDTSTGFPYACLEASLISATRTAASAVLAAEALLGGRWAERVGFVGAGFIAGHVRRFLGELGWDVGGYRIFDLRGEAARRFAADLGDAGDVAVVERVEDAITGCDLVVLATVAGEPHLAGLDLLRHGPVILHISLRDLHPELVLAARNITDDIDHALRERTSLHLAEQAAGHRRFVHGTIADLLSGSVRREPGEAVIFAPFGLGVLDLALASWIHRETVARGGGTQMSGVFPEV